MYWSSSLSPHALALSGLSLMAEVGFALLLIALALAVLAMRGHARLALSWGSGIFAALGFALLLKHLTPGDAEMRHFPSGHVTLAVAFYGGLGLLFFQRASARGQPSGGALIVLFILGAVALAEGASRVSLTEHSWLDVAGGFVIGMSALALTGNPWTWNTLTAKDRLWLIGALLAALPFAWLVYAEFDPVIREFAGV